VTGCKAPNGNQSRKPRGEVRDRLPRIAALARMRCLAAQLAFSWSQRSGTVEAFHVLGRTNALVVLPNRHTSSLGLRPVGA